VGEWDAVSRKAHGFLRLYVQPDIFSTVADNMAYPSFKEKWDRLKSFHGGEAGSTVIFNMWIRMVQTKLDDNLPLGPQFAKLTEARAALSMAAYGVTNEQFSLILLNALPASYEALQTILLASGPPGALKYEDIILCAINEEGRRSSASSSLNAAGKAPIKRTDKKDHSKLVCHYCNKKGHIKPNCKKRKKDESSAAKGSGSSSGSNSGNNVGSKAANSHVLVPTTASIKEVDESIGVALYAAKCDRWMLDSGATHHMTPFKSDFATYAQCNGTVKLGDVSSTSQIGVGTVVFKSRQGIKISLSNVLHVPNIATWYLSTQELMEKGAQISMDKGAVRILVNGKCVASGYTEGRLLWIDVAEMSLHTHIKSEVSLHTWHLRMGHMSHNALKYHGPTAITGMDLDVSISAELPKKVCQGCEFGKSTRKPFPGGRSKKTTRPFEVVHSDLCSPMQSKSIQGLSTMHHL